jgi:hypothetical protein
MSFIIVHSGILHYVRNRKKQKYINWFFGFDKPEKQGAIALNSF